MEALKNAPALLVISEVRTAVASFVNTTTTRGITFPVVSRRSPTISASEVWP
jgi:hypothetical protein